MLKRLGTVAWWLGAMVLLLSILAATVPMLLHRDCSAVLGRSKTIESAAHAQALAHPDSSRQANGTDVQPVDNDFARALAMLAEVGAEDEIRTASAPPEFWQRAKECESYKSFVGPLFGGVGAVGAALLWAFAFVLAGSFWRPPKRYDAAQ